jgi:hypothetical protein
MIENQQQADLAATYIEAWDRGESWREAINKSMATYDEEFRDLARQASVAAASLDGWFRKKLWTMVVQIRFRRGLLRPTTETTRCAAPVSIFVVGKPAFSVLGPLVDDRFDFVFPIATDPVGEFGRSVGHVSGKIAAASLYFFDY